MPYHFNFVNNHIIADIGGKMCLIDTGAPTSMGEGEISIDNQGHLLGGGTANGVSLREIADHVGTPLDALIGGDILSKHGEMDIWLYKDLILFSDGQEKFDGIPFELYMDIPVTSLNIKGKSVRAFVDTGAKQSYVSEALATGLPHVGEAEDFYPGLGAFKVPLVSFEYSVKYRAGNLKFAIVPPALSQLLAAADCQVILGVDYMLSTGLELFKFNYVHKMIGH
ncbi:MAG: hypothetical protein WCO55_05375 [Candidatus Falkowbacteria bacterium]